MCQSNLRHALMAADVQIAYFNMTLTLRAVRDPTQPGQSGRNPSSSLVLNLTLSWHPHARGKARDCHPRSWFELKFDDFRT